MGIIKEEVFLGTREQYNQKLRKLATMAQEEVWTFGKDKETDPYQILRNYFQFTYNRLSDENKILTSADGTFRCMNTGLLTKYNQEIVAIFTRSNQTEPGKLPWYLTGFFKDTDRFFNSLFDTIPDLPCYYDNPEDLIYNQKYEIKIKYEHIIEDNYQRFVQAGYANQPTEVIAAMISAAMATLHKKLARNFKLALPFYRNNGDDKKIQLLVPIYFPGAPVKLAVVLNKLATGSDFYYEAVTVLPVEWAYMNARLIVKPDEEWAKIIEEADAETLEDRNCSKVNKPFS